MMKPLYHYLFGTCVSSRPTLIALGRTFTVLGFQGRHQLIAVLYVQPFLKRMTVCNKVFASEGDEAIINWDLKR
jgi:hypothetical protein